MTEGSLQQAFIVACRLDVEVRKPGNVSVASPGHGMDAALFVASARAAAAPLCARGAGVGERIEAAMRATLAVAGCNTNLGIVLLAAPLLHAAEGWHPSDGSAALRVAVGRTLAALDRDDAAAAYRAIALARPAGLGRVSQQDVAATPTVGLREAMALAADRDRIARQYASGYADVFDIALPALQACRPDRARGVQRAYLELLSRWPDSHIVRKHGAAMAHSVMAEAAPWRSRAHAGTVLDAEPAFVAWDSSLKSRGINPGTTADLVVTAALADLLLSS
ncbi:MAG: triphosphoribosyl-dephospho-CoA synthase [Burkholderiaceae bacterium]